MIFTDRDTVIDAVKRVLATCAQPWLMAIDGCGASGKSTLAAHIAQLDKRIFVVHVDDMYRPRSERLIYRAPNIPVGGNFDLDRLLREVLIPYRAGAPVVYKKYDWVKDVLADEVIVPRDALLIVEGVYSLHDKLRAMYTQKIWIECPRDLRLRRGIERDGEGMREFWTREWMPLEDVYLIQQQPYQWADYCLDGSRE